MKTSDLLLSGLDITEDRYIYEGKFILSTPDKSKNVNIGDLDLESKLLELKTYFALDETPTEIRRQLMDMVMENANIVSKVIEGENYEERTKMKHVKKGAANSHMA